MSSPASRSFPPRTVSYTHLAISEAKDVLAKKGATYQNVYFDSDGEAGKFTTNIFAYPTTYEMCIRDRHPGQGCSGGF